MRHVHPGLIHLVKDAPEAKPLLAAFTRNTTMKQINEIYERGCQWPAFFIPDQIVLNFRRYRKGFIALVNYFAKLCDRSPELYTANLYEVAIDLEHQKKFIPKVLGTGHINYRNLIVVLAIYFDVLHLLSALIVYHEMRHS